MSTGHTGRSFEAPEAQGTFLTGGWIMPDNPIPATPAVPEIQSRLREVAQLLRQSRSLDPASRRVLAELVDELGTMLQSGQCPAAEVAHLAGTTAQLAEAL